jgi:hypothetical protein
MSQIASIDNSVGEKSSSQSLSDMELAREMDKLRQIFKRRQKELEEEDENICDTRWVQIDDGMLDYYGFKHPKFCNTHWVNKTLFVVHRPTCKKPVKCHCCGELCVPQFLCIPCSGEINKSKRRLKKTT